MSLDNLNVKLANCYVLNYLKMNIKSDSKSNVIVITIKSCVTNIGLYF